MKHRGEVMMAAIKGMGVSISEVGRRLSIDNKTIYNWAKTPNLPYEKIMEVGRAIGYDFRKDLPKVEEVSSMLEDPETPYGKAEDFKEKYYKLLEQQNNLLRSGNASFERLVEAINKHANTYKQASDDLGTDIKLTMIKNNKELSECLLQIARMLEK